uniref:Uncharacterized protein n=1 Tax=Nelumbo nucifera TaxID=4432 RepID=A0A822ZJW6_NELNU|nr:TPA_asm: hypothetical protein HUJ06_001955 [Nelumbo nucifera]
MPTDADVIIEAPVTVLGQPPTGLVAGESADALVVGESGHEREPSPAEHVTSTINEDILGVQLSSSDIQVKCLDHPEFIPEIVRVEVDELDS